MMRISVARLSHAKDRPRHEQQLAITGMANLSGF